MFPLKVASFLQYIMMRDGKSGFFFESTSLQQHLNNVAFYVRGLQADRLLKERLILVSFSEFTFYFSKEVELWILMEFSSLPLS